MKIKNAQTGEIVDFADSATPDEIHSVMSGGSGTGQDAPLPGLADVMSAAKSFVPSPMAAYNPPPAPAPTAPVGLGLKATLQYMDQQRAAQAEADKLAFAKANALQDAQAKQDEIAAQVQMHKMAQDNAYAIAEQRLSHQERLQELRDRAAQLKPIPMGSPTTGFGLVEWDPQTNTRKYHQIIPPSEAENWVLNAKTGTLHNTKTGEVKQPAELEGMRQAELARLEAQTQASRASAGSAGATAALNAVRLSREQEELARIKKGEPPTPKGESGSGRSYTINGVPYRDIKSIQKINGQDYPVTLTETVVGKTDDGKDVWGPVPQSPADGNEPVYVYDPNKGPKAIQQ